MAKNKKRINTYFRQTASSFRAARQTQIFAKINRNLPYRIYHFSRKLFASKVMRMRSFREDVILKKKQSQKISSGKK